MTRMNLVFQGKTVNEAWEEAYDELAYQASNGHTQGSRDGDVVGEVLNATFIVHDPTRMIVTSDIRKMPMRYAVGELMWYLSGSNKTKDISKFSKVWNSLSDDGEHSNSAYGYRIFEKFGLNQWETVKSMLKKDPLSRQAIIHIKAPEDNVCVNPTKDLPCTLSLQFFIRDEEVEHIDWLNGENSHKEVAPKLHMTVHMRSNDIWTGTPYDMFAFCCLQIKMAMELGIEIGTYTHTAGSLHLYRRNYKEIEPKTFDEMLDEGSKKAVEIVKECINKSKEEQGLDTKVKKLDDLGEVIACDFDGTLFEETKNFPEIGAPIDSIIDYVKIKAKEGARVILWTCRNGKALEMAVKACEAQGLKFDAINENLEETKKIFGNDTRKVWATEYLDDKGILIW